MTTSRRQRVPLAAAGAAATLCMALLFATGATGPTWWSDRGVIDTQAVNDDYQAANAGQLMSIATLAHQEMEEELAQFGGAGPAVAVRVAEFNQVGNYEAINQGQLKHVAEPFYGRLIEIGYCNDYPWGTANQDDYGLMNIGQLKNVFSFDLALDSDTDGMPDWWELANGLNPNIDDSADDADSDGLTNIEEFGIGTQPSNWDSDGDRLPDGWENENGLDPNDSSASNGADGDPDGDGVPNYAEYLLQTDPQVANYLEVLGPSEPNLAWVYKLAIANRSKSEGEAAFVQPPEPDPLLYYLDHNYDLEAPSPNQDYYLEKHAHLQYNPGDCSKSLSQTDIEHNAYPCIEIPGGEGVEHLEVTLECEGGSGTVTRHEDLCNGTHNVASEAIICIVAKPGELHPSEGWTMQNEEVSATERRRVYDYYSYDTYQEDVVLSSEYTTDMLDSVARGNVGDAESLISGADWGEKVLSGCSGVAGPLPWGAGDQPCAVKDLTGRDVHIKLQELFYGLQFDTEANVIYRVDVLHIFEVEDGSRPPELQAHHRYYFKGTGSPLTVSEDTMVIEPPGEEGRVCPVIPEVQITDVSGSPADEIRISKWPGAFSGTGEDPSIDATFIESDGDGFQVRASGLPAGMPEVTAKLSTYHESTSLWDDGDTELILYESAPGVYASKTVILVSNDIDDNEIHHGNEGELSGAPDDALDDRTHIARLHSKVKVRLALDGTDCGETEAVVPKPRRVFLNVKILKDGGGNDAVGVDLVDDMLELAREFYSQVGIELEWNAGSMTIAANPTNPNIDLSDGIAVLDPDMPKGLTLEAQAIIDTLGTSGSDSDLHMFFVEPPFRSAAVLDPEKSNATGVSLNQDAPFVDSNYLYNAFVIHQPEMTQGDLVLGSVFTVAHELGHLLGITGHRSTSEQWCLMFGPTDRDSDDINNTKRLDSDEEILFHGSAHVESIP